jgi:hypothetical protein
MDILSIVNGDNLFKYCFTLGLAMVIFALVYPLEKQHLIQLEIINHNKETALLNKDIFDLTKSVSIIQKERDFLISKLKVYKMAGKSEKNLLKQRAKVFNENFKTIEKNKRDLDIKTIVLEFNKSKIKTLQMQENTFGWYSWLLVFFGVIFIVFGFIFWAKHTFGEMNKP